MLAYLLRRVAMTIPTLLLVAVAVFTLMRLIPGDPVQLMLGEGADPAQLDLMRRQMGLDQPLPAQFLVWLRHALAGDLGVSTTNGLPVLPLILERFQVSAVIVLAAVAIATLIAVPAGLVAAWRKDRAADLAIVGASTLMLSVPSFWLGLLLLMFFGQYLGWLPVVGYVPMAENFTQGLLYVILPVATLALVETGVLTRMSRASTIEILRLEYVTHARAKGVPESQVLRRHVLPNAFNPTLTMIGLILGHLLSGIAVLETVFTLPGLGRLMIDSIFARDYPVLQGCLLFTACIYVAINLIVDMCYPLFDPRVSVQ
ncbi:ABC transporter permease [Variovorax sp. V59]|uniref:Peptide/nickel transport system permease protein n=1 Tax=Variovorax paradoxus TaxID=34073 RepID=A0AAE4BZU8_VARPD|nr:MULTISPECIES: ABC transporter permease [Variovorax]MBD9668309.1 ABC transporter permease [Variovorax sp. VRV01]MDP9967562.1 peptide/nickel transport system permease protein [Variovorax paradoxus]MDR6429303.1 peptide/nickel transport system permease protein [Variovorax paradoxus]